jgi:glycosyltransferase involved in cell wall biosynthesis
VYLKSSAIIPHGISEKFRHKPLRRSLPERPTILYVSDFMEYKFQWEVARGLDIARRKTGIDLQLYIVGKKSLDGWKYFEKTLIELHNPKWIKISEYIPYNEISKEYHMADIFVFASTVETIGNILLEAMASGLPIAYSNRRPMTDILGDDGVIFEPEDPQSIANSIQKLCENDELRFRCANNAYQRALVYNWERTANETFAYLKRVFES